MATDGLTPAQQQQVKNAFLRSLKKAKPTITVASSDARRGGTYVDVKLGNTKSAIASSGGRQLRTETGNFL